jgi:magnesium chelatase family protein
MLDCIDIFVEVPRVDYEKLSAPFNGESSVDVRRRAQAARDIQ